MVLNEFEWGVESLNTCFSAVRKGTLFALFVWLVVFIPTASVSAQSDKHIVITQPLAGAVIESGSTIFFTPGDQEVYQWRVTIGASPEFSGLFDSGIRLFNAEPWEVSIDGMPNNGKPVTLRFWQRPTEGGSWIFTDTVFNTRAGDAPVPSNTPVESAEPGTSNEASLAPKEIVTVPTVASSSAGSSSRSATAKTPAKATAAFKPAVQEPKRSEATFVKLVKNNGSTAKALQAQHRDGQTFITWSEVQGEAGYHVYRHTSPITSSNIDRAEKLTARWGPLDSDTSINKHAHGLVPTTYVISDLGQPLAQGNGLFVNTTASDGAFYYAVTTVAGGRENSSIVPGENSLLDAVSETVAETKPVLTLSLNQGKGRLYTQYMDYANWNPTFNGYVYNYSVTLPAGYKQSRAYPLQLRPHAYGEELAVKEVSEYNWQVIQIFPQDPGSRRGSRGHSWWFGYSGDHNYLTDGPIPKSGSIVNFTEERVMKAIKNTIDDPGINVDQQLVTAFGHSMGASGSLALGTRYGNVFAGIFGNEAMTNYSTNPKFQDGLEKIWGSQSDNLPVKIRGHYAGPIARYNGTGVWDWMNHQQQLIDRRGDRMAYLMLSHGKADNVIDWKTQGAPMARVFNEASVGYSSRYVADAAHSWLGFNAIVKPLFGFGPDTKFPWRYPNSLSFPAISNASGSGPLSPGLTQTDTYNLDIEWATPHTSFAKPIIDKPDRYEISLRSISEQQTADITPRNSQQFAVRPGEQCGWIAVDSNKRKTVGKGTVTADEDGLVTIPKVLITPSLGTRLAIECS